MKLAAVAVLAVLAATDPKPAPTTDAGVADNGLWVQSTRNGDRPPRHGSGEHAGGTDTQPAAGGAACQGADHVTGEFVDFCTEADVPVLTVADIQRAFAELPLPASTLIIQPPDGLTLVNFATNFYTTSTHPITTTVTLLDQHVTLEATPATYHWSFGDGESTSTRKPGAPYPDLTITHHYQHKGALRR
ncbi:hypothetical protein [Nocardioides humi]|uniref:PKD domain-containing protein n=1 Tax=Nocardioides humi TaxID=449461 RepID=A0ABN2BVE8_9ACTN|nr:hypothetical protein [Nocardioides humi]